MSTRPVLLAVVLGLPIACLPLDHSAQAAKFEIVDDEETLCVLRFKTDFEIVAAKGGGDATQVWLHLNGLTNVASGKKLRLELQAGSAKSSYQGEVAEYIGAPEFAVSTSLVDALIDVASFSFKLDKRPPVVIKDHLTPAQVREFKACMSDKG